jgi:imidazolonepropionase-like amidohydrolase
VARPNSWLVPGAGLHTELELLHEAGLGATEVIRIATRNAAEALGILGDTGTIEGGKRADLVLLDADPTLDIRNTRRIAWVMQSGRILSGRTP